jgi:enhancing lycopene biosynthesis protein 2
MKRRIGILLSGCGAYDGSDPQEAVLAMLEIQRAGHAVVPLAMDAPQMHCVDHMNGEELPGEDRNQMRESARLIRGKLYLLQELSPKLLDGLIIPGGQGAVKNLMANFGSVKDKSLPPDLAAFIADFHAAGGTVGAISLAEFVVSLVLGPWPDGKGCFDLRPDEVLVDEAGRRLLTPGNTQAQSLPDLQRGIHALCVELFRMLDLRDA